VNSIFLFELQNPFFVTSQRFYGLSAYGAGALNKIVSCLIFLKLSAIVRVTVTVSPISPPLKKKATSRPKICGGWLMVQVADDDRTSISS
jgi:hypothetical protein